MCVYLRLDPNYLFEQSETKHYLFIVCVLVLYIVYILYLYEYRAQLGVIISIMNHVNFLGPDS